MLIRVLFVLYLFALLHAPVFANDFKRESLEQSIKKEQMTPDASQRPTKEMTEQMENKEKGFGKDRKKFSVEEKAVFERVIKATATTQDKEEATNICAEKCLICFDGRVCDFDCVREKCMK